ncbi:MAG: redoxin family protein [Anaplasmataceae bacterium]|nr:redoxin family protein [Anaplasmataceae bacterium]
MTLLLLSFIAGVLTVLAPCILPVLPIIIGGSISDTRSKLKPYIITASLAVSLILFTLLLKFSTALISIPPDFWKWFSGGIIFFFGLTYLFPVLWEKIPGVAKLSSSSNQLVGKGASMKNFTGDIIIGAALGPVFATCSPTYFIVLATVLPVNFSLGLLYMVTYALGLSIVLLLIALLGQRLTKKLDRAANPYGLFKRSLGVLFIIVAILIATGYDKKLQIIILDAGFFDVTKIENSLLENLETTGEEISAPNEEANQNNPTTKETNSSTSQTNPSQTTASFLSLEDKAKKYKKFIELSSPDGFINTANNQPITIGELIGEKVILLDIWTYSCINCQRTLPYLRAWYDKYEDQGLEIIGLHTPEFAFEKVYANVAEATKNFGLEYPIVLDNDYSTWNAYGNRFWPRKYLIDIDGYVVYDHIGEGAYDETEKKIQQALAERAARLGEKVDTSGIVKPEGVVVVDASKPRSPETYFGAWRNTNFGNGIAGTTGIQTLTLPSNIAPHTFYLNGEWNIAQEYATNTKTPASIVFKYQGQNVYLVASADNPVQIEIWRDGQLLKTDLGNDISSATGRGTVQSDRLYHLIKDDAHGTHTFEIKILNPGLKAFTFTFG